MNFTFGAGSRIWASDLYENHEEKDFPETSCHRQHVTSPIPDLRTQACQINY